MRILVLGGTQFVGRHFVEAALAAGHDLTLFHRGRTGPDLFPQCAHILGDRLVSLDPLADGAWDALVDVNAYVPRAVRMAADALADRVGYTLQVSTISVYDEVPGPSGVVDEESPKQGLEDPDTEEVTGVTYGGLKWLCEEAGRAGFERIGFVRPTYVVGPYDHTERFTTWVDRFGRNRPVVCPVRPDGSAGPLQWIDARDLAEFMVRMLESQQTGAYNACADPAAFLDVLAEIKQTLGSASTITTVTDVPEGLELPMMAPLDGEADAVMQTSNAKAKGAGLTLRPLADTVRDLWAWWEPQGRSLD